VGLIARQIEAAGIATLCMTCALDITKAVNPPRAAFLDYPLGQTAGKVGEPALQRAIMIEALQGFTTLVEPGSVKMLSFRWDESENWKHTTYTTDTRLPRSDTPQYQCAEDRVLAEQAAAGVCITGCGLVPPE
jgi:hypothetical protein